MDELIGCLTSDVQAWRHRMEKHLTQLIANLSRWRLLLAAGGRSACRAARLRASCGTQGDQTTISHGFISTPCIHSVVSNTLYPLCGERGWPEPAGISFLSCFWFYNFISFTKQPNTTSQSSQEQEAECWMPDPCLMDTMDNYKGRLRNKLYSGHW